MYMSVLSSLSVDEKLDLYTVFTTDYYSIFYR